jgi:hypothetical protein
MAEEDDGAIILFSAREGDEVTDVVLESERVKVPRSLIPTAVVRDEIESIGSSCEPGEGAASVETSVDADDRGFGILHSSFGDRETRYRRIVDEVQSVGSGGGTHAATLPL